jgi:hypothetical protein
MNKDLRKKTTHACSTKCSQTTMAVQIDDTGRLALLGLARFLSHNPNVNTIDEVWLKPSLRVIGRDMVARSRLYRFQRDSKLSNHKHSVVKVLSN